MGQREYRFRILELNSESQQTLTCVSITRYDTLSVVDEMFSDLQSSNIA